MLAVSTVVLVSAERIGRLLFCNLHMTVGLLLMVLGQPAMEGRKEEVDRLLGEFLLPWAERFCEPMYARSALSAWLTVKRSSIWNATAAIFTWPALRPVIPALSMLNCPRSPACILPRMTTALALKAVVCSPAVEIAGCGIRAAKTYQVVAVGTELRLYSSQHLTPDSR
jgi:hypothetical protein